jgi:hypothetical protein
MTQCKVVKTAGWVYYPNVSIKNRSLATTSVATWQ